MFSTLSQPYAIAGKTVSEFAIAIYEMLTSAKCQRISKDAFIIASVVIQITVLMLYGTGLCAIIAGRKFRTYYEAEWAADVQRFLTHPDRGLTEEAVEPVATTTTDTDEAPAIPAAVQTILDSNMKTTKKLRSLATYFGIRWRNANGEGKHLLNADIKRALMSCHPEILAAL